MENAHYQAPIVYGLRSKFFKLKNRVQVSVGVQRREMQKWWEYKRLYRSYSSEEVGDDLKNLGIEGWEAYAITDNYIWLKKQCYGTPPEIKIEKSEETSEPYFLPLKSQVKNGALS